MKNAITMSLAILTLGLTAVAAPKPWLAMVGKYAVPETCSISHNSGFSKAKIEIDKDGKMLQLRALKNGNTEYQYFAISNFQKKASGTDGNVFYAVSNMTESSFLATEHFVRKGSKSWPDMESKETFSLSLDGDELTIIHTYQSSRSARKSETDTCVMTSLQNEEGQIISEDIKKFSDKDLEKLAKAADVAAYSNMDLDQAGFQVGKFEMNLAHPSKNQIKEVLVLHANLENVEIKMREGSTENPKVLTEQALHTALDIPEKGTLETPKYKDLVDVRDAMVKLLKLNKSNLRLILVKWSGSDSDGEGLLLIDETTGQALYVGSGYFS